MLGPSGSQSSPARSSERSARRATRGKCAPGSVTGRSSCRSTSTSSTPRSHPGPGTPEVAGFSTAEALGLLRALRGVRLVGADVVEVAPPYDPPGQPTAVAAANVALDLLALRALSD